MSRTRWSLFRTNATAGEKILTIGFLVICLVALFGMIEDFSPSTRAKQVAWLLGPGIASAYTVALQVDRHPASRMRSYGPVKRRWLALAGFALMLMMAWMALALGVGAIATSIAGTYVERRAQVVHIANPNHGKGCKFAFVVKYAESGKESGRLCASEKYWSTLRTGQHMTVVQRHSPFGFLVAGFRSDGDPSLGRAHTLKD